VKERPILFSGAMVWALLREVNPKTQTRRVIKPPSWWEGHKITGTVPHGRYSRYQDILSSRAGVRQLFCPYGSPGDRLWVKETFTLGDTFSVEGADSAWVDVHYRADGQRQRCPVAQPLAAECRQWCERMEVIGNGSNWKPSIFMRREFSRLTLEITAVRVERLQDISTHDAEAEGVQYPVATAEGHPGKVIPLIPISDRTKMKFWPKEMTHDSLMRATYAALWESINGPGSWAKNPWVWVIEFKRLTP
jgi:hypothetical protein